MILIKCWATVFVSENYADFWSATKTKTSFEAVRKPGLKNFGREIVPSVILAVRASF